MGLTGIGHGWVGLGGLNLFDGLLDGSDGVGEGSFFLLAVGAHEHGAHVL